MEYTHLPIVSCFYADESKDYPFDAEAHYENEMILVTGGHAILSINQKRYMIQKRSLIFINRMERHRFTLEAGPFCRYVTSLSADLILSSVKDMELISIFAHRPNTFSHVVELSPETYAAVLPLFQRMAEEYSIKPALYVSQCSSLVVEILIEVYRAYPDVFPDRSRMNLSDAVLNVQRYINDHLNEPISLEDLAQSNHVTRHSLSKAFSDVVGTSFKNYLIQFRINEAQRLLVTTTYSIEEIGEMIGYSNVNNFIRIFKSREGLTPLQYRKRSSGRKTSPLNTVTDID